MPFRIYIFIFMKATSLTSKVLSEKFEGMFTQPFVFFFFFCFVILFGPHDLHTPYLNSCVFFLRGYLKSKECYHNLLSVKELECDISPVDSCSTRWWEDFLVVQAWGIWEDQNGCLGMKGV